MSRVKQQIFDNEQNNDLIDFLGQLLEKEELENTLNGIAKQVMSKGIDSMSDKQKVIVNDFVEKYKSDNECPICIDGNISKLTDYIEIAENGFCPLCMYDKEQLMK